MTSTFALLIVLQIAAASPEDRADPKLADFLSRIGSDDDAVRLAARQGAAEAGPAAIIPLARLTQDSRQNIAAAARSALEKVALHAGRPGADADRAAASAELEKLLAADQPAGIRREAVHLLGFTGGDGSVPAVARLLDDADARIQEAARLSLERIPGAAAVSALGEAARRAGDERKPDFLYSIAKKGESSAAVAILSGYARDGKGEIRLTALEGLARLGSQEAIPLFNAALESPQGLSKERLFSEYLRLADALAARGNKTAALALYSRSLTEAPQDFLREHALFGACPAGDSAGLDLLIAGLGDAGKRTRGLSIRLLTELQGSEVIASLRKAYVAAPKDLQPALLMAMAEKDKKATQEVLEQASQNAPTPELKITALDLLGRLNAPEMAPVYLEVAANGFEIARPIAIKGYLQVAKSRLDAGDKELAYAMYQKAVALQAASNDQRTEALRGAIATAHPQAIELSSGFLNDAVLGSDAATGMIKLVSGLEGAQGKAAAEKFLEPLLNGNFPEDVKTRSNEQLRRFGIDHQAPVKSQGFIVNWWISTPIQDPERKGFDEKYYPEEQIEKNQPIDFEGVFLIGPRRIRWRKIDFFHADGKNDLLELFRRSENVLVYGYAELNLPAEQEAVLRLGSDDGIGCWLNGRHVLSSNVSSKFAPDANAVRVRLQPGINRILIKVTQRGDEWCFSFQLTDTAGKPIDLRKLQ